MTPTAQPTPAVAPAAGREPGVLPAAPSVALPHSRLWLALAWLLLRLESPAWQALRARQHYWYPHLAGRRPRPADPLRYLLQTLWLMIRRPQPAATPGRLRRLLARWRQSWHDVLHQRLLPHFALQGPDSEHALGRLSQPLRACLVGALALLAIPLALLGITEPFDWREQLVFVGLLWGLALFMRHWPGRFVTLLIVLISVVVSCRYLWWRYTATLNWHSPLDLTFGLILLAAETYAWLVMMLGYLQTSWPLQRQPAPLPADSSLWPTVDLLIPTYNEDLSVVRPTVYAALGIDWPADKLRIHLLDDGRRESFRQFAAEVGIGYIVRPDNRHAKAGNLNHALQHTDGELVAIFDCDHVPVRSFLQVTAGWFLRDPKLALVQTPHHFFSPDPFERNLGIFRRRPNEGELFYGLVQDGNDLWNAAFFCGSCALLRRTALESVGGFAVETVTEDAHTALRLHRKGWNSAYLRIPQAAGLATESLSAHIAQRIRWARGMAQIFRTDNPLLGRGLSFFQRICYANAMLHFLAGLPRLVFLIAPLAFLLLHAYIIYAPALMIVLYVLPHMIHASLASSRMQGAFRQTFWGEVYETVLAWYIVRPTTMALLSPRHGAFNVTAKGGLMAEDQFDWRTARPYLLLALLNVLGLGFAIWRLYAGPATEVGTVIVSALWVLYNLLIIGAAVAVAAEARQIRRTQRVQVALPAALRLPDGHLYPCQLSDYAMGGVGLDLGEALHLEEGSEVGVVLYQGTREQLFRGEVGRCAGRHLAIRLAPLSLREQIAFVQCTFARADAWLTWRPALGNEYPLRSFFDVLRLGGLGYRRLLEYAPAWLHGVLHPVWLLVGWLFSFVPRTPSAVVIPASRELRP
ncbi:MAG: UDP-forming cellulose synthase catalytic subunit [Pseudomonas sp.]|nr:UDP-forming cellulose synthase catalytic subunit [Pseudomonas sp.]